mmetsp:Transcript_74484/g.195388  ORF Transcript_74484/g.195388 Transcript_74484/m.195388 type:complete len:206 (+) Transcript_74484:164-781(+)
MRLPHRRRRPGERDRRALQISADARGRKGPRHSRSAAPGEQGRRGLQRGRAQRGDAGRPQRASAHHRAALRARRGRCEPRNMGWGADDAAHGRLLRPGALHHDALQGAGRRGHDPGARRGDGSDAGGRARPHRDLSGACHVRRQSQHRGRGGEDRLDARGDQRARQRLRAPGHPRRQGDREARRPHGPRERHACCARGLMAASCM